MSGHVKSKFTFTRGFESVPQVSFIPQATYGINKTVIIFVPDTQVVKECLSRGIGQGFTDDLVDVS